MKTKLFLITILALLLPTGIIFFVIYNNYYLLKVNLDTIKSTITTIITASGSFIGFIVIYLSISYERFKKNYGKYAPEIFGKDKLVWSLIIIFIVIIFIGLLALLLSDSELYFTILLFNFTCYYFFIALLLLIPYGYSIIQNESFKYIEGLIDAIKVEDFINDQKDLSNKTIFQIINETNKNKVDILVNILYTSIEEKNTKNGIAIIVHLFKKITLIINDFEVSVESKKSITSIFINMIESSFNIYKSNRDNLGIETTIAALNSYNHLIAENKLNEVFIDKISDSIGYIARSLIESENEPLIITALWGYCHMVNDQISINIINEKDTWEEDTSGFILPKNTKLAQDNDSKFDSINSFAAFKFNDVIERVFLSKNYHIIESSIKFFATLIEMLLYNNRIGEFQLSTIASQLIYYNRESIQRYAKNEYPKKTSYLSFFIGNTHIIEVLKKNSNLSNSIFKEYINLINFIGINNFIETFDLDKISGLTRLIIANSPNIINATTYVEQMLVVQKQLHIKYIQEIVFNREKGRESDFSKTMATKLQNGMNSYLSIMERKQIINEELKSLLLKYK